MQVINDFDNEFIFHESVSTVGTFDGIHCGHVEIIRKMKMAAEDLSASTVVVTFSPHPRSVVTDDFDIKLLTPLEEKLRLFEELGINYVLVINFTKDFSKKTYEEFFD